MYRPLKLVLFNQIWTNAEYLHYNTIVMDRGSSFPNNAPFVLLSAKVTPLDLHVTAFLPTWNVNES